MTLVPLDDFRDALPIGADPMGPPGAKDMPGASGALQYIAAVAARGNDIFVVDSGQRMIFRIDRTMRTLSIFGQAPESASAGLYLAADYSLYVVDRDQREVVRYDRDGRVLERLSDASVIGNPVDVVEAAHGGNVLVADSLRAQIAEYDAFGGLLGVIGDNFGLPYPARSISAIARGASGLYVLDAVSREIRLIDAQGMVVQAIAAIEWKQPTAIAVDRCERLFIADRFDNTIYMYRGGIATPIHTNAQPGLTGFQLITDLWVDEDVLYVADGPAGRVQVLRIEGEC